MSGRATSRDVEALARWRELKLLSPFKAGQHYNANERGIERALRAEREAAGPAPAPSADDAARVAREDADLARWRALQAADPLAASNHLLSHEASIRAARQREAGAQASARAGRIVAEAEQGRARALSAVDPERLDEEAERLEREDEALARWRELTAADPLRAASYLLAHEHDITAARSRVEAAIAASNDSGNTAA